MQKLYSHNIRDISKVDLHRHLDCSVRWSTLIELAPLVGIDLPRDPQAQKDQFLVSAPMKDLDSVLKKFLNAQKVLASTEILTRIAYEACEDAFNDGVRILELRYAPSFIADGHAQLTYKKIHNAIVAGVELARRKLPMAVGLICILQRVKSYAVADGITNFAIDQSGTFIALDLADNENGFDPKIFAPLFQRAKQAGLHITVHSGESPKTYRPNGVRDSVDILGAERIGHGVQIIRDARVIDYLRDKKIPLEICPISNWLTQAFATHEEHPIRRLMDAGVLVTINSDDPGVFGTRLSDDYEVLHRTQGFTLDEFKHANQIAYHASFINESDKAKAWGITS